MSCLWTLKPQAHKLTREEQSLGGKRSGEARRRKAYFRELCKIMTENIDFNYTLDCLDLSGFDTVLTDDERNEEE